MRKRRRAGILGSNLFWATGWLFADLFLALAMGFMVANTVGQPLPMPTPTPTLTPTVTMTPTPLPALEHDPTSLILHVDYAKLLAGDPATIQNAEKQVRAAPAYAGRRAGLVLSFGGAPLADPSQGAQAAAKINKDVLMALGKQGFLFYGCPLSCPAYREFHDLGLPINQVRIEVYLFKL